MTQHLTPTKKMFNLIAILMIIIIRTTFCNFSVIT